ncbi:MAG: hypothetical protein C4332_07095 [Meiothermus sp.]
MVKEAHSLTRLEKNIKALDKSLKSLAGDDGLIELLKIIHFPGWTTPAEFMLVSGLVEGLQQQVSTKARLGPNFSLKLDLRGNVLTVQGPVEQAWLEKIERLAPDYGIPRVEVKVQP